MRVTQMENENKTAIEIHDMTVAYHKKPVLWNVDTEIPAGKLAGIIGPNGAGKSTMIKAMLDLVPKASGWAKFYGQDYRSYRKNIGYVPQRESVDWDFPISAFEVTLMGRYSHIGWVKRPGKKDRAIHRIKIVRVRGNSACPDIFDQHCPRFSPISRPQLNSGRAIICSENQEIVQDREIMG